MKMHSFTEHLDRWIDLDFQYHFTTTMRPEKKNNNQESDSS